MKFDAFIREYYGTTADFDGAAGVQCVDLAKLYLEKVYQIAPFSVGSAKNYYLRFAHYTAFAGAFEKHRAGETLCPQKGDLCVWGSSVGGGHGHVAVAAGESGEAQFDSYDMNWNGKAMKRVQHDYDGLLGVLRPLNREPLTETDQYFPACAPDFYSIADALISIGESGSYSFRKRIAAANGIEDYCGTPEQNLLLLELLREGMLLRP